MVPLVRERGPVRGFDLGNDQRFPLLLPCLHRAHDNVRVCHLHAADKPD